jgi:molybdopterin molybdotransferase
MTTAAEASTRILEHIQRLTVESVPLNVALGSVLAEDVVAPLNAPPWRNASMDGYAVRSADITDTDTRLRVIGDVYAGEIPVSGIERGEAMKIMTGAPVPDGADTVIRVEDTSRHGELVEILNRRDSGHNVRPMGEDYRQGETLAIVGDVITPGVIGVLASAGTRKVNVYRKPTVAIVASGDELVMMDEFESVQAGRKIISSNSYSLPALVRQAGGLPCDMGIAADNASALRDKIEAALGCDIVVTTGGVSVGDRDYTRAVLQELGADIKFWRVRIRPGGPLAFGIIDGSPWLGLAGNPVSAMVTFELYVRPAILKMSGHTMLYPLPWPVVLDEPVRVSGDLTHFLRAIVTLDRGRLHARLTGTQSSGALTSMARANALLVVPEGRKEYLAGEPLTAIPLAHGYPASAVFPA